MTGTQILSETISLLVGGITGIAEGIGSGIQALVNNLFFVGTGETQSLSIFAILTIVFAGIALAIGLCRLILHWLSTLGGSRV